MKPATGAVESFLINSKPLLFVKFIYYQII